MQHHGRAIGRGFAHSSGAWGSDAQAWRISAAERVCARLVIWSAARRGWQPAGMLPDQRTWKNLPVPQVGTLEGGPLRRRTWARLFPDESGPVLHLTPACGRGEKTVTGCIRARHRHLASF